MEPGVVWLMVFKLGWVRVVSLWFIYSDVVLAASKGWDLLNRLRQPFDPMIAEKIRNVVPKALNDACRENHLDFVSAILEYPSKDEQFATAVSELGGVPNLSYNNVHPLCTAIDAGSFEIVQVLLKHGADPNILCEKVPFFLKVLTADSYPLLEALLEDPRLGSESDILFGILFSAIRLGKERVVGHILTTRKDLALNVINGYDKCLGTVALENRQWKIMDLLLKGKDLPRLSFDYTRLFLLADAEGGLETLEKVINHSKLTVSAPTLESCLYEAKTENQKRFVQLLMANITKVGLGIDFSTGARKLFFDCCIQEHKIFCGEMLLTYGAYIDVNSWNGQSQNPYTLLDLAPKILVQFLEEPAILRVISETNLKEICEHLMYEDVLSMSSPNHIFSKTLAAVFKMHRRLLEGGKPSSLVAYLKLMFANARHYLEQGQLVPEEKTTQLKESEKVKQMFDRIFNHITDKQGLARQLIEPMNMLNGPSYPEDYYFNNTETSWLELYKTSYGWLYDLVGQENPHLAMMNLMVYFHYFPKGSASVQNDSIMDNRLGRDAEEEQRQRNKCVLEDGSKSSEPLVQSPWKKGDDEMKDTEMQNAEDSATEENLTGPDQNTLERKGRKRKHAETETAELGQSSKRAR